MGRKKFSIRLILLIFLIFLLNYLAMEFYWYTSIWYFDMIMHFLGGVWLSLAIIYFSPPQKADLSYALKVLLAVFAIGFGWEIFEVLIDRFITQDIFNLLDTLSDLFFDVSGGAAVLLYLLGRITVSDSGDNAL